MIVQALNRYYLDKNAREQRERREQHNGHKHAAPRT